MQIDHERSQSLGWLLIKINKNKHFKGKTMKKFIAMLTLLIGFNANAGLLTIDISSDDVVVGDSVSVTISASNFDDSDMFWFDFNFDNSVMSFDENSISSDLTLSNDDNGLAVTPEDYGLAFLFSTDDFLLNASGDFVLASFNLIADAAGVTDFSIFDLVVFSEFEETDPYTVAFTGSDSVNVNANSVSVPEPSTVFMMMFASFALVSARRQKNS